MTTIPETVKFVCDDGTFAQDIEAETAEEAAWVYVRGGDWTGDEDEDARPVTVTVTVTDPDGDTFRIRVVVEPGV